MRVRRHAPAVASAAAVAEKGKIAVLHVVTSHQSVVTILRTKLRGLASFPDLDVAVCASPPEWPDSRPVPVPFHSVSMVRTISPIADFRSVLSLRALLLNNPVEVLHSHTAKAGFIAALAGRLTRVPRIIHTYHGLPYYSGQSPVKYWCYRSLEKLACRLRDHVFTQNEGDYAECCALMGAADRVSLEGNGVDVKEIERSATAERAEADRLFVSGRFRIAMLSRLEPVKRVSDFILAMRVLRDSGVKFSAVVAGSGPLGPSLDNQVEQLSLAECVRLVGYSSCPCGILAASDAVVLCSEKEGLPRSLLEGMALGKPVVATDAPGTREVVTPEVTGFLVPVGRPSDIAERLARLAQDASLRARFGEAGRRAVLDRFDEGPIVERLHDFYASLFTDIPTAKPTGIS